MKKHQIYMIIIIVILLISILIGIFIYSITKPKIFHDSHFLIEGYTEYKNYINACYHHSCIIYTEFYYKDATELFKNNLNYKEVNDKNIGLLTKMIQEFETLASEKGLYNFNLKQIKPGNLYYAEYKYSTAKENTNNDYLYFFKLYYFDTDNNALYYLYYLN